MTRLITANASKVTPREFLRFVFGDPNDISQYPQVEGCYLKGTAWLKIKPYHVGVKGEQPTEVHGDPLLNKRRVA